MTDRIEVALGARSYQIHVGPGLLARAGALIAPLARSPVPIVTDETVAGLHGDALLSALAAQGLEADTIILPAGEATKSWASLAHVTDKLLASGLERGGALVAFGGGVIGDLAGLAAGLTKRGVDYVQIPTTLLAQVDSSVGGKTAINTPAGKNLVGLFHQPKLVIADTGVLSTLPARDLRAGYAEVVKYGAIGDAEFFGWLEHNGASALAGKTEAIVYAVAHSCQMKAEIVSRDEREDGDRALLNLGHTFGHALEAATGYSGRLLHGEGVAIGMTLAFALSVRLGFCPVEDYNRLVVHLGSLGLPTSLNQLPGGAPDADKIFTHMKHDKKAKAGKLSFVLVRRIGDAFVNSEVPLETVRDLLAA